MSNNASNPSPDPNILGATYEAVTELSPDGEGQPHEPGSVGEPLPQPTVDAFRPELSAPQRGPTRRVTPGEPFVPFREVQRVHEVTPPIGDDQLYILFLLLTLSPQYFREVRPRLLAEYFDQIYEAHWRLFWLSLCRCHDLYGGAAYATIQRVSVDVLQAGAGIQLNQDQARTYFEQSADGLLYSIFDTPNSQIGPDSFNLANDVLRRFLFERTIALPMRRLMSTNFATPGAYPADLGQFLEGFAEQHRELNLWNTEGNDLEPVPVHVLAEQLGECEELCRGVLVPHQLAVIGGQQKTLKTLVGMDLGISLAIGLPFLGHAAWACPLPQRVGFFSGESGGRTLTHKANVILEAKIRNYSTDEQDRCRALFRENFLLQTRLPDLGYPVSVDKLRRVVRRCRLGVVFLDTLYRSVGSASKEMAAPAVLTNALMQANDVVAEENGTLIFLHHTSNDGTRRAAGRDRQPLEIGDLGYTGVSQAMRQWILLSRAEPYDHTGGRISDLWLNIGGSGLQEGGVFRAVITEGLAHDRWDTELRSESAVIETERTERAVRESQTIQEQRAFIAEYLRAHPEGVTARGLSRARGRPAGMGDVAVAARLVELGDRLVERDISGISMYFLSEGAASVSPTNSL